MHTGRVSSRAGRRRELLWVIYDFPFNYLKVRRIFATVLSTNERAMKIAQKMGFSG